MGYKEIPEDTIRQVTQYILELNYTLKQIDDYLQGQLKPSYPFRKSGPYKQKLCGWFEVPMQIPYQR
jgi:hypothetical protein